MLGFASRVGSGWKADLDGQTRIDAVAPIAVISNVQTWDWMTSHL
jgi:hypothetical protein